MITSRISLRFAALICLAACAGLFTGCGGTTTASTAFTDFVTALDVASVTSTGLCGAGKISASVCAAILPALSSFTAVVPQIQTELESSDPLAIQVSKSVGLLAPVVSTSIPGLSTEAQAIINGVSVAAQLFISVLQSLAPAAAAADAQARVATAGKAPSGLTSKDRQIIATAVKSAATAKARIDNYIAAHK